MIQRLLISKNLVAYALACATGLTLYFKWPFPESNLVLHLVALRAPITYLGFKYGYELCLFSTPYIGYSLLLSGVYIFALRPTRHISQDHCRPIRRQTNGRSFRLFLAKCMILANPFRPAAPIG